MVGKLCVYEIVVEFGVDSKVVFVKLKEFGEFVKSLFLIIELLVVCKLCVVIEVDGLFKGLVEFVFVGKFVVVKFVLKFGVKFVLIFGFKFGLKFVLEVVVLVVLVFVVFVFVVLVFVV